MEDTFSQLLLDCFHRSSETPSVQRIESLSHEDWERLLVMAARQTLSCLLYHRLKARGFEALIPGQHLRWLKKAYLENAAKNLRIESELNRIIPALRSQNIRCIVLKGPHLAAAFYENQALRTMSDIDLLVPLSSLSQAKEVLCSLGYETSDSYKRNSEWQETLYHLPVFSKPASTPIELHWGLMRSHQYQADIVISGIWERALAMRIGNVDTLGLCATDMVLYLSSHACKHRLRLGLRSLLDIAQVLSCTDNTIWPELISRSHQWGVQRSTYLILRLVKDLLGVDAPLQVLSDLKPADFNEQVFSGARELVIADLHKSRNVSTSLAKWQGLGPYGRVSAFFQRAFLPKNNIAELYDVPPRSMKVYWYYLIRCKDLLAKYLGTALSLCRRDEKLTSMARRKICLNDYLDGK